VKPHRLDPAGSYAVIVLDRDGYEFTAAGKTLMVEGIPLPDGLWTLVLLAGQQ